MRIYLVVVTSDEWMIFSFWSWIKMYQMKEAELHRGHRLGFLSINREDLSMTIDCQHGRRNGRGNLLLGAQTTIGFPPRPTPERFRHEIFDFLRSTGINSHHT